MNRWAAPRCPDGGPCRTPWPAFVALASAFASAFALAAPGDAAAADGPAGFVRLEDQGAVCDGRTDNSAAIERAIDKARRLGVPVLVPKGRCAFGDVIHADSVTLAGSGPDSVLHALDWARSAIFMSGASPAVRDLTLSGVPAPSRQAPWEMTRITVFTATDFAIERVVVEGAAAAGIQTARGPTRGRIVGNIVRNTLSDGIHLTGGASHILVEGNLVERTGDDGIAVVSYWTDRRPVSHITARHNVVRNTRWGRNMSVVGGSHVRYDHNLLQGNQSGLACLYIAQEARDSQTKGARDVRAEHNTLEDCGGMRGHAAAMVFSDGKDINEGITLLRNEIRLAGDRIGIRVFSAWNVGVRLEANRITGTGRPLAVSGPSVVVTPYDGGPVGHTAP